MDNPEAMGDELAVDRSPYGGSDDIPAKTWGDSETFDAAGAAELLGDVDEALDQQDPTRS